MAVQCVQVWQAVSICMQNERQDSGGDRSRIIYMRGRLLFRKKERERSQNEDIHC